MNVNKILILLVLVISFFQISFSVNICNVGLSEPWFKVNSVAGENILIVDKDGDVFLRGKDHLNSNSKNERDSFEIGNLFFNSKTSYFNLNNFYESQSSVGTSGLIIKSASSNKNVASFSNSGIKSKGKGIYQGSQSNCMSDGYIYCNLDDVTRENRDYYCNITGDLSGSCKYNVIDSEDCSTKLTIDTDGNNIYTKGHVIDYTDCSVGNCNSNTYYDTCNGNSNVYEFTADNFGTGFIKTLHSCGTDGYVCVGSTSKYKDYSCGSGACSSKYTSSTSCSDGCNTKNGRCKVDCVGSWVGGSTCSATCGGGHYTDTYKITTAAQNGGKSCSNNNGDTRTGGTCNTQDCPAVCTPITSCGSNCGTISDGCEDTLDCGTCTTTPTCTDDCSYVGQTTCGGRDASSRVSICGDYDTDSCLEWETKESCGILGCSSGVCNSPSTDCNYDYYDINNIRHSGSSVDDGDTVNLFWHHTTCSEITFKCENKELKSTLSTHILLTNYQREGHNIYSSMSSCEANVDWDNVPCSYYVNNPSGCTSHPTKTCEYTYGGSCAWCGACSEISAIDCSVYPNGEALGDDKCKFDATKICKGGSDALGDDGSNGKGYCTTEAGTSCVGIERGTERGYTFNFDNSCTYSITGKRSDTNVFQSPSFYDYTVTMSPPTNGDSRSQVKFGTWKDSFGTSYSRYFSNFDITYTCPSGSSGIIHEPDKCIIFP